MNRNDKAQAISEFAEGIGEDDDLGDAPQFIQKFPRALQRMERADDLLNIRKFQPMLRENGQASFHQDIIIRFITGGAAQFADAGFLSKSDPDLRHKHAFQVEGNDGLFHGISLSRVSELVQCWMKHGMICATPNSPCCKMNKLQLEWSLITKTYLPSCQITSRRLSACSS